MLFVIVHGNKAQYQFLSQDVMKVQNLITTLVFTVQSARPVAVSHLDILVVSYL
jgi:hypothetical protein